jgi:hypothetical protein
MMGPQNDPTSRWRREHEGFLEKGIHEIFSRNPSNKKQS